MLGTLLMVVSGSVACASCGSGEASPETDVTNEAQPMAMSKAEPEPAEREAKEEAARPPKPTFSMDITDPAEPAAVAAQFSEELAWYHLESQVAFGYRYTGSPGHAAVVDYLEAEMAALDGWEVEVQRATVLDSVETRYDIANVIGRYNSSGSPRLLIGTHYDTRPFAEEDPDPANHDQPILGANDGGSGTAVMLMMAEMISSLDLPIAIDFVYFDAEDQSPPNRIHDYMLGSKHYVRTMTAAQRPDLVLVIDMVADRDLQIPYEQSSLFMANDEYRRLFSWSDDMSAPAFIRTQGWRILDDHTPFQDAGIRAMLLIDFDYPQWHTLDDTLEACSAESMGQVGRTVMAWLLDYAARSQL